MKTTRTLIVLFMSSILAGHCLAQADQGVALVREYIEKRPNMSMKYHVHTGRLEDKLVEFTCAQDKYSYKDVDPDTGSIELMLTYDGLHCYDLLSPGIMHISASPNSKYDIANSWFVYNPLYNPFALLCQEPDKVLDPALILSQASMDKLQAILGGARKDNQLIVKDNSGNITTYTFSLECPFPTSVQFKLKSGDTVTWKTNALVKLKMPNGQSFPIADEIECTEIDSAGRKSLSSYTINLVKDSVRVLTSDPSNSEFQIPLSIVKTATDTDTGVVLKREDWSTK